MALVALIAAAGAHAAQHEGLGAVRERGYIRVCADPDNMPYSSNSGPMPGFEVELARLIAAELGVTARIQWHPTYVRALKPLREGSCELFMGLPTDKRFREGNPWIAVSRPYYLMAHSLVGRADGPLTVPELKGKRVAVELASIAESYIAYRDIERALFRSQEEAFRAFERGDAVAAFLWRPVAVWLGRGRPEMRVVNIDDDGLAFPIGVGMRKRESDVVTAVEAAVTKLIVSGQAQEVFGRYGLAAAPRSRARDTDIVPVQQKDPVDQGRSLFSTACSRCHGADGVGGGTGGTMPKLKNYDGGWDKFYRIVWNGRKNTAMAAFSPILSPDEVRSIYEYLTSLKQ